MAVVSAGAENGRRPALARDEHYRSCCHDLCVYAHTCVHARHTQKLAAPIHVRVFRCLTPRPNPVMARMSGEARMASKPWTVLQRREMRTCAPTSWGTATANGASAASGSACRNRVRQRTRKAGGIAKPECIPVRAETMGRPIMTRGAGPCTLRPRPGMPATAQPIPWVSKRLFFLEELAPTNWHSKSPRTGTLRAHELAL